MQNIVSNSDSIHQRVLSKEYFLGGCLTARKKSRQSKAYRPEESGQDAERPEAAPMNSRASGIVFGKDNALKPD